MEKTNWLQRILEELNIINNCRKYGLSAFQCPQFLFFLMGILIILSTITAYILGNRYIEEPLLVAFVVILTSEILLVIAVLITRSFERLAEANRLKSEFVSVVSHQLRSPLSNLKWSIEILMSGRIKSVTEKELEFYNILRENSQRMEELVADLLIVSRIDQGKFYMKKEECDLANTIKEVVQASQIFARASNTEIISKIEENLPRIMVSPSQIKQAVENLLDNAIRYSKDKGTVEIFLEKKNRYLCFMIKDSGVGIPKVDQRLIFQRFFRSDNALRHKTEGSGLGLYIAKSIIEKSGGKIGFKSQENVGSTFWFTLPINAK